MDDGSSRSGAEHARGVPHHVSTSKQILVHTLERKRRRHDPRLTQIERPRVAGGDRPGGRRSHWGVKVRNANGWFAARPSGTKEVYKMYAESFQGEIHRQRLIDEAQALINTALAAVPPQTMGRSHS